MKKPNTLPELLRHAANLAEKGELLANKFEYRCDEGWTTCLSNTPNLFSGYPWRIADQDQHLLDDGWIKSTSTIKMDMDVEIVLLTGQRGKAANFNWLERFYYKVEPTTFEMKVGDKVFVLNKPYMSAPEMGKQYWVLGVGGSAYSFFWYDLPPDKRFLNDYNCWRTEADAKAYAKAYAEAKLARDKFEIGEIK
jgi:hypothetical protein